MMLRKSLAVTVLVCLSQMASFGQQMRRTPEERAQRQTDWMQKNLALSEDQNKKIYNIQLHYAKDIERTREYVPAGGEKRAELRDEMKDKDAEIKAVLTGEQYEKYRQLMAERREKMKERKGAMQQDGY